MTARLSFHAMPRNSLCQIAAAAAIVFVMAGALPDARAATTPAASAPAAASAPLAAGSQYTIRPGQSLNDVAIAATQSHDRATLVRASRALFDANPNAFMGRDPSRLRQGATLTIPALDATGAAVDASGGAASSGASSVTATAEPALAQTATAANAAAQEQPGVAAQANPASAGQHGTPAITAVASEPLQASSATAGAASAPSATSEPVTVAASSASSVAAVSASQASGAHVWSGAIQASTSVSASAAEPSVTSGSAPVRSPTQVSSLQQLLALKSRVLMELQKHGIGGSTASQPSAGAAMAAGGQAGAAHGTASGSVAANNGTGDGHFTTVAGLDLSSTNLGIAAAIGAALVALLAGLGLRRRKRAARAAEAAQAAAASARAASLATPVPFDDGEDAGVDAAARGSAVVDEMTERAVARHEPAQDDLVTREVSSPGTTSEEAAAHEANLQEVAGPVATAHEAAAREAAAHEAAEHEAATHEITAQEAEANEAEANEAEPQEPGLHKAATHEIVPPETPNHDAALPDALANQAPAPYDPAAFPVNRPLQESAHITGFTPAASEPAAFVHTSADEVTEHTSAELAQTAEGQGFELPPASDLDMAAGLREGTVPPEALPSSVEPADGGALAEPATWEKTAHLRSEEAVPTESRAAYTSPQPQLYSGASEAEQPDEPSHGRASIEPAPVESDATAAQSSAPGGEHTLAAEKPRWDTPEAFPLPEPLEPFPDELAPPKGFPRDAVDAFGSLDLGLPPRGESDTAVPPDASLNTHPVAAPEIGADRANAPQPSPPGHVADEIAAGIAGAATVAGLGAARFGALNLDFDLELPPSPAQPLPLFTPEDLGRIARNKLDLASEYIELGDLAGARALIHEVIEANDAHTRTEARALLSTLAPLS
jgi:pilus assembly protein FimV